MTILITGGSGVVGRALVTELARSGRRVRALARSDRSAAVVAAAGAEPVHGDVLDHRSVIAAMTGCEVVYHVAGVNEMCSTNPASMDEVNVEGTRIVVRAAGATGVRRLVYTSSAVTIGEAAGTIGLEASPHRGRFLSRYERSKWMAERVAFAEAGPVEVVSVNPSSVQGPGRSTGTGRIFVAAVNGRLPAVMDGRISVVDIEDCTRGHILAELHGEPGRRYLLNGFTLTVREAVDLLASVTGVAAPARRVPRTLLRVAGVVVGVAGRLGGRPAPFCTEMARTLLHGHAYDGSRAVRELGLEYRSAEDTLRRAVAWFESQGLLDRPS